MQHLSLHTADISTLSFKVTKLNTSKELTAFTRPHGGEKDKQQVIFLYDVECSSQCGQIHILMKGIIFK
ncbi:hypothetical protein MHYP_G00211040 [Metynnis hypsauchen]